MGGQGHVKVYNSGLPSFVETTENTWAVSFN